MKATHVEIDQRDQYEFRASCGLIGGRKGHVKGLNEIRTGISHYRGGQEEICTPPLQFSHARHASGRVSSEFRGRQFIRPLEFPMGADSRFQILFPKKTLLKIDDTIASGKSKINGGCESFRYPCDLAQALHPAP